MNLSGSFFFLGFFLLFADLISPLHLYHWALKVIIESTRIHLFLVFSALAFIHPLFIVFAIYWLWTLKNFPISIKNRIKSLKISVMNKSDYEIIHFKNRRNYLLPLVYLKSPNAQSPNLIMVHGGAYKYGNSLQQLDTLKMFQQMGFNVFSLPYSLLPEKWPFAFEDILDGFSYIEKNFSSAKYIIAGRSAGAHLAALLVKEVQPILKNRLLGFINFYGIMDFIDLKNSLKRKNLLKFDRIFEVLFQEKQNDELFLKSISPAHQVDKFFPPTLIFHGSRDSLVPLTQSLIFQNELNKNSIKNELVIFQGVDHVMEWNLYSPCGQIVTQKIELFLNNFKVTTT